MKQTDCTHYNLMIRDQPFKEMSAAKKARMLDKDGEKIVVMMENNS